MRRAAHALGQRNLGANQQQRRRDDARHFVPQVLRKPSTSEK